MRAHRIRSGEVELAAFEAGERGKPPVLLVHGFPDDHAVWSRVVDRLASDFHVATFDLRGVGGSTAPRSPRGFHIPNVLPDFTAVIDAIFGANAKVHLVGHDWGSVLSFSFVADPVLRARVRSFTSISGPHVAMMLSAFARHLRQGGEARRAALRQLASSWYVLAMQVPRLPETLFSSRGVETWKRALVRGGVPKDDPYLEVTPADVLARTLHPIELYRQNVRRPPPLPAPRSIDVPLLLVVPEHDPFVRPATHDFLPEVATDLRVERLDASHWVPRSHPAELAVLVREHAARADGGIARKAAEGSR